MTPRPRRRLATTGLVLALAGPVAAVALAATVLEHRGRRLRHDGAGAPDVVVVLGAGLRGTAVTRVLDARLRAAVDVAGAVERDGRVPVVVVSGGQGPDEVIPESAAMRRRLLELGLLPDRILEEDAATSTRENLRFAREVLTEAATVTGAVDAAVAAAGPWTVVTSTFHLPRTALIARRAGIAIHPVGARSPAGRLPKALLREAAAIVTAPVRGGW